MYIIQLTFLLKKITTLYSEKGCVNPTSRLLLATGASSHNLVQTICTFKSDNLVVSCVSTLSIPQLQLIFMAKEQDLFVPRSVWRT